MSDVNNIFDVGMRAMSAQMVRMNTVASNLANVGTVSSSAETAYRAIRPVFETVYSSEVDSLSTAAATSIQQLDREPEKMFRPDHPAADAEGFVYKSTVNPEEEMVEMMEASRQYQNTLEALSTMRELMARTMSMGK
ncbi:flagellar basal body rod protein FlgC [Pelagovum sp. HNIBRBA483]|uniref:flagellar basal body rod protein FlgC n=1 Tax=Pelagovum sp. HNIBRBA483 TaxID=3233341 RepID=UPI0034A2FE31